MKYILFALTITFNLFAMSQTSVHHLQIQKLHSTDTISLSDFEGKKILIVNVASKCGYTSQYTELQKLHEMYSDSLVIIGIPCNQFLYQESGTEEEIVAFCQKNYGVSFLMSSKVNVKGKNQHPLYSWLTQESENGVGDFKVGWNFNKFLIDENGNLIAHFDSSIEPLSDEIQKLVK